MTWNHMDVTSAVSDTIGISAVSQLPDSEKRFEDGSKFRIEIPSAEGPDVVDAVLSEADARSIAINRISQGSGGFMLTDSELEEMVSATSRRDIELMLFARPQSGWCIDAGAAFSATGTFAQASGMDELVAELQDLVRMSNFGVSGALVTDLGVLKMASMLRKRGLIRSNFKFKGSVQMGLANPVSIGIAEELGLSSYNVSADKPLAQFAEIRRSVDIPLDIYIESPDNMGGFMRYHEIREIVRVAAPVYLKFGVRNAPDIYPSGQHLRDVAVALGRERVRRAEIALSMISDLD